MGIAQNLNRVLREGEFLFERMKSNIIVGQGLAQNDSKESHAVALPCFAYELAIFWGI